MEERLISPLRIDFAGGWLDVPEVSRIMPGIVVNGAILPHINCLNGNIDFNPYVSSGGVATSTAALILEFLSIMSKYSERKIHCEPETLAESIYRIENHMINYKIGRQDQYAISLGGINCLEFNDSKNGENISINFQIYKKNKELSDFESKLLLLHSGVKRPAQNMVKFISEQINKNNLEFKNALKDLAYCGAAATQSIKKSNFYELSDIMTKNWDAQKRIIPCSSKEIDQIFSQMLKNGANGGKMCGAGGGGYFVFYCNDIEKAENKAKNMGLQTIRPVFEMKNILELNNLKYA